MNIFITGAGGFTGKRLIFRLAPGHAVMAWCNRAPDEPFDKTVRCAVGEIEALNAEGMRALFGGAPFAIVHLAYHSPREKSYAVAARHIAQMAHLLEISKGLATCFISLGSADEYGAREGKLAPEAPPLGALSPYGWSKRCAGTLLASQGADSDMAAFWLRPFTVYGETQRGQMLIPYAVAQARAGQEALFSDGLQERDFIHVDDVVEAIMLALQSPHKGFHAVNLGWGKPVQVRQVLLEIARGFNVPHLFKFGAIKRRPDEPMTRYADVTAAQQLLGWQPRVTLEEGLQRLTAREMAIAEAPALRKVTRA